MTRQHPRAGLDQTWYYAGAPDKVLREQINVFQIRELWIQ